VSRTRENAVNSSNKWNVLIVLLATMVVVGPIVSGQFHPEIARWHLAAVSNAMEIGIGDAGENLEKAASHEPDLESLSDYWILEINQALKGDRDRLPKIIDRAISKDPRFARLGKRVGLQLEQSSDFMLALEVLERSFTKKERAKYYNLNLLAYLRSLADVDDAQIEQAFVDINLALEEFPEKASLRDTRAWVQFQMGDYEEALEDAEFAVTKTNEELESDVLYQVSTAFSKLTGGGTEREYSADDTLSRMEAGDMWTEGVMRYHRARILEALDRTDKAEPDWQWIKKHHLPIDDRLH